MLLRETWHSAISGNVFDLVRYTYVNGRPTRIESVYNTTSDLSAASPPATWYMQYNWHGDAITMMALDGAGGSNWTPYDPWGNPPQANPTRWNYYRWNGAWGYQYFEDLGLYYAHGRWYNPDTGMWLSPNAKGDYMYGGDGQDAVNWVWTRHPNTFDTIANTSPSNSPTLSAGMPPELLNGILAHITIMGYCLGVEPACRINVWTGAGFADIVIGRDVYEIKPDSDYGKSRGPAQLAQYVADLTKRNGIPYRVGTTWQPNITLPMVITGSSLQAFTEYTAYPGIIFYKTGPAPLVPIPVPEKSAEREASRLRLSLRGAQPVPYSGQRTIPDGMDIPQYPIPFLPFPYMPSQVPELYPFPIRVPIFQPLTP